MSPACCRLIDFSDTLPPLLRGPQTLQPQSVCYAAWSPSGKWLATGSGDGTAKVWDAATGKELLTLGGRIDVWGVAWSPDGKRLATAGSNKTAKVWEVGR